MSEVKDLKPEELIEKIYGFQFRTFRPREIKETIESPDTYYKIKIRLKSSLSGAYYYIHSQALSEFSEKNFLNRAPYNPLFSCLSRKFLYVRVVDELFSYDLLERWMNEMGIKSPMFLFVGWCKIKFGDDNRYPLPHRLKEIYVMEAENGATVSERAIRKFLVEKVTSSAREIGKQGNLCVYKADSLFSDAELELIKKMFPKKNKIIFYNHAAFSKEGFYLVPFDEWRLLIPCDVTHIEILSYEHSKIGFSVFSSETILLRHPVPQKKID